jgi:flagellar hook-basal body complex protein FliE
MVSPIRPVTIGDLSAANGPSGLGAGAATQQAGASDKAGFAKTVGDALSEVGRRESAVKGAAEAAAVGDLRSVNDYMIAASEAQLATEITVAVRDRAITAFNDIMRMQI